MSTSKVNIDHIVDGFDSYNIYDLIKNPIVFKYYDLFKYRHKLYKYFLESLTNKSKEMISTGFIHSEFYFVRRVGEDKFKELVSEFKAIYGEDTDIELYTPYTLNDSEIKFISLENKLIEFTYKKELPIPDSVKKNPITLRHHLVNLSQWYYRKHMRFVLLKFPHMDITLSGTNMTFMRYAILKELPLFNKNIFKGFLIYSKKITDLKNKFLLDTEELENRYIYQAVKNLDTLSIGTYLQSKREAEDVYEFNFLDGTYTYNYNQSFYNLFQKIRYDKQSFLLTQKALDITYSLGFHFVSKMSNIVEYLHKNLTYKEFKNIRKFICDNLKKGEIDNIFDDIEEYIMKRKSFKDKLIMTVSEDDDYELMISQYDVEEAEILF